MKKNKYLFVLIALIAFHVLNNYFWLNRDVWPIGKDYIIHLNNQVSFSRAIENGASWNKLIYLDYEYPPMFYVIGWLIKYIFGNYKMVFIIPSLFFVMLIICVYGIGKTLVNKDTGVMAAYLCSFFPFIYKTSVQFNLELATAALSCLIILLILSGRRINRFTYRALLIIAIVIAGLTRQLIFLFIIGPLIYYLLMNRKKNKLNFHNTAVDIMIAFATSAGILVLFYYHDINTFITLISKADEKGLMPPSASNSFLFHAVYYIRVMPLQLNWVYFLFFIFGVLALTASDGFFVYFFLAWIVPPTLVLTLVYNKFPEFTIANLPIIALTMAWTIQTINNIKIKRLFELSTVVIGMCLYFRTF